jgi:Type IV Pilus-assembly protein W/Prokaryotic N-terminal methylation motif
MPARTRSASPVRGASRRGEHGLTLIETLVAVTVLVAIMIGLYTLLDSSNKLAKQETNVAEAQQSARVGIFEVSRLIRQARVGQLYYGNAVLPVANNAPGGTFLTDLSGTAHYIRKGTDVIEVRGILLGERYTLTSSDVDCNGIPCNAAAAMTVTVRSTSHNGVVNWASGTTPVLASKTRPFYFVVTDASTQTVNAGGTDYRVPLYYVGVVDTTGNWYTQTADTFSFTMNPQDSGAQKLNAGPGGAPALQKPYAGGPVDQILFFVDEGSADASASPLDTHPALAEAIFDPSSGRYDIQPLVDEVEDFQVAYGVDGISGTVPDRGISPVAFDASAANLDEWVGNVATEVQTSLVLSSSDPKRVDAFLDTSVPSVPPNWELATPALRSVWISLVVKATDPDFKYDGPGATGIKTLDSTAVAFSDPSVTGRRYRRRLQSFAVALRNYQ